MDPSPIFLGLSMYEEARCKALVLLMGGIATPKQLWSAFSRAGGSVGETELEAYVYGLIPKPRSMHC